MRKDKINKRYLILCEGMTEYLYAKSLQMELPRDLQRFLTIDIIHEKQNDPKSLAEKARSKVREAKRDRNPYDQVWIFFDNDNWPQLPEAFKIIDQEGFGIAYSSMCFEHWLILHLENVGKAFTKSEDVLKHLHAIWPEYHKTRCNPYKELKDVMDKAIERAEILNKNSNPDLPVYKRNPYFTIGNLIRFFRFIQYNKVA